jgi:hypothetical protein
MHRELIRDVLLVKLANSYEIDPSRFVTLSKQTMDSSFAREVVAELRNLGYLEEQVRGIVRLTRRGYEVYGNDPLPYAYSA